MICLLAKGTKKDTDQNRTLQLLRYLDKSQWGNPRCKQLTSCNNGSFSIRVLALFTCWLTSMWSWFTGTLIYWHSEKSKWLLKYSASSRSYRCSFLYETLKSWKGQRTSALFQDGVKWFWSMWVSLQAPWLLWNNLLKQYCPSIAYNFVKPLLTPW